MFRGVPLPRFLSRLPHPPPAPSVSTRDIFPLVRRLFFVPHYIIISDYVNAEDLPV